MTTKTAYLRALALGFYDDAAASWSHSGGLGLNPDADAVDLVEPLLLFDDAKYIQTPESGASPNELIGFTLWGKPNDIDTVNFVEIHVRCRNLNAPGLTPRIRLRVRLRGLDAADDAFDISNSLASYAASAHSLNPTTGIDAWLPSDIADDTLEIACEAKVFADTGFGDAFRVMALWLEVNYEPIPPQTFGGNDAMARRYFHFRSIAPTLTPKTALVDALGIDITDRVLVSHADGPEFTGAGWQSKKWQRRQLRKIGDTIQPGSSVVTEEYRDIRNHNALAYLSGQVNRSGGRQHGNVFFGSGSAITVSRASEKWIGDADGSGHLRLVTVQQPAYGLAIPPDTGDTQNGVMLEHSRINHVPQSSFKNQKLGWTETPGSGVITAVTSPLLFDQGSQYALEMAAHATSHASETKVVSTASASIAANSQFCVSLHTRTGGAATTGIVWRLIRSGGGSDYWSVALDDWTATPTDNTTPLSDGVWTYTLASTLKTIGTGAHTVQVELVIPVGSTAAALYYIGHVQINEEAYPSSALITDATPVATAVDEFEISNASGARSINNAQGAVAFTLTPNFTAAEVALSTQGTMIGWDVPYGAGDRFVFWWHVGNARWEFRSRTTSVNTQALNTTVSPVRGVPINVVCRWIGDESELGLAPYTASLFLNGVKGTDATPTAQPVETTLSSFLGPFDGTISNFVSLPYVPTDEECGRFPLD